MTRHILLPGLRVLARGRDQIQIGLGARRLLLSADVSLRRVLAALDRGEAVPADPAARRALARLTPLLVDGDRLTPPGVSPAVAAAVASQDPSGFVDRLAARGQSVAVLDELGSTASDLLRDAGFRLSADNAAVALVLAAGEPDRGVLDRLVRGGIVHQLVRAIEGELVVGPLVVPGHTACLRCLDAHRADQDPLHPVLVALHHRARRHDGVPEPVDSALLSLATGWAVRDLVAQLDGDRPATWSATVRIGADLNALEVVAWQRHPACSCVWASRVGPSATMTS